MALYNTFPEKKNNRYKNLKIIIMDFFLKSKHLKKMYPFNNSRRLEKLQWSYI